MRRRTKSLALPAPATPPAPQPSPDGLYRNTVIEAPYLDAIGRRLFVACGPHGHRIDEGVAVSEAAIERLRTRLWGLVETEMTRDRPRLVDD